MQGLPLVYIFIYFFILLKFSFFWGGGVSAKLMFGYNMGVFGGWWGDGVRNFEYIGPADAFDCARLSWPMSPVGKWLPGTAFPGWDQILEWSLVYWLQILKES